MRFVATSFSPAKAVLLVCAVSALAACGSSHAGQFAGKWKEKGVTGVELDLGPADSMNFTAKIGDIDTTIQGNYSIIADHLSLKSTHSQSNALDSTDLAHLAGKMGEPVTVPVTWISNDEFTVPSASWLKTDSPTIDFERIK